MEEGNAAYESHDFNKAEARWKQIRDCDRGTADWPKAVFNLGFQEHERKNPSAAIGYFEEILRSHPDDKEPGGSLMETNRNYSYRSAMEISHCYEELGSYRMALRYARLAQTTYPFYSWCGTCAEGARRRLDARIAYLTLQIVKRPALTTSLLLGIVLGTRKVRSNRRLRQLKKLNSGSQS